MQIRSAKALVLEVTTIVALIACTGLAGLFKYRSSQVEEVLAQVVPRAARAEVHDRLVGTMIDLSLILLSPDEPLPMNTGRPAVVWILDAERCRACFDTVDQWARLEGLLDHDLHLFWIGPIDQAAQRCLRVLRKTQLHLVERNDVVRVLGDLLPNTKLLLGPERIVTLVDSRTTGQGCDWSFEAQVGTLTGTMSARAIRGIPVPISQ